MIKITKDGITKYVAEKDLSKFNDLGFKVVQIKPNKPEPMVISEPEEKTKKGSKGE